MPSNNSNTIFQLIRLVLDKQYERIEANDDSEKNNLIEAQFKYLSDNYSSLMYCDEEDQSAKIDYGNPATRFAYIYKYVTHHANVIFQLLEQASIYEYILSLSDEINISAIGGGPGSELLGMLKFMNHKDINKPLTFVSCDIDHTWVNTWHKVNRYLRKDFSTTILPAPLNVCDPMSWKQYRDTYTDVDIITMTYFLSEVYCNRDLAQPFFDDLIEQAPPLTVFLFVDNNDARVYDWFDNMMKQHQIKRLRSKQKLVNLGDRLEQKTDLGQYWNIFGSKTSPKLQADVAYRIYQKPKPF